MVAAPTLLQASTSRELGALGAGHATPRAWRRRLYGLALALTPLERFELLWAELRPPVCISDVVVEHLKPRWV
ncbi:MAG TPA: hypothetical protein VHP33_09100 [Polyangiaceae bacterium]|nr:hypothetical protein [Polyangiaceae bacterium]